jgi:hypothetical protein
MDAVAEAVALRFSEGGLSAVVASDLSAPDKLVSLIEIQVGTAVRMRDYPTMVFDTGGMSADLRSQRRAWTRAYENLWAERVSDAMVERVLSRTILWW